MKGLVVKFGLLDRVEKQRVNSETVLFYKDSLCPMSNDWTFKDSDLIVMCPKCRAVDVTSTILSSEYHAETLTTTRVARCGVCKTLYKIEIERGER